MNFSNNKQLLAGAIGGLLLVLVVVTVALFPRTEEPQVPIFEATVAENIGAVSYNVFIPEVGPLYTVQLWPRADGSRDARAALEILVKLGFPGNALLIDERARVEVGVAQPLGVAAPVDGWLTWSRTFEPSAVGLHEIVLAMPQGSPKILLRVGDPQLLK